MAQKKYITQKVAARNLVSLTNQLNIMFLVSLSAIIITEEKNLTSDSALKFITEIVILY